MKEAAGEANMTVITIAIIAVIAAVGVPLITSLVQSSGKSACCTSAGGTWTNGKCMQGNTDITNTVWDATNKKCK